VTVVVNQEGKSETLDDIIPRLKTLLQTASMGPWGAGHLGRTDMKCQCRYIFDNGHMGGIAEVYVDNGIKMIADGANDCPPLDEAVANLHLIVEGINALPALIAAYENLKPKL
jgi:hypothetical protein